MSASATSILHWNAIPVFADIESEHFTLDPRSVEGAITSRTNAIMVVDIFGQSAQMDVLRSIATKHGLKIINDSAQAPGSVYKGSHTGTLGDIGGYSLNYHKHIHTGEGGVLVTNDSALAKRMRLIRNHAEAVVGGMGETNLVNMVGHNYRMGEIEASIGQQQLRKLPALISDRQNVAASLREQLSRLPGLRIADARPGSTHVYYVLGMILDLDIVGAARDRIVEALEAEGITGLTKGYTNLHMLPMYQQKIAYGSKGFPWTAGFARKDISYKRGICPNAENLHEKTFIGFEVCLHQLTPHDIQLIGDGFRKVWDNLEHLGD
jgi:dTDP-4-amino-4,6-dideoxygalactose transaminase